MAASLDKQGAIWYYIFVIRKENKKEGYFMSVLSCTRAGCENIMCDRFSPQHGYLCSECFEELVGMGAEADIYSFLDSVPRKKPDTRGYEKWNEVFPVR
jgi:hypothetical protein